MDKPLRRPNQTQLENHEQYSSIRNPVTRNFTRYLVKCIAYIAKRLSAQVFSRNKRNESINESIEMRITETATTITLLLLLLLVLLTGRKTKGLQCRQRVRESSRERKCGGVEREDFWWIEEGFVGPSLNLRAIIETRVTQRI